MKSANYNYGIMFYFLGKKLAGNNEEMYDSNYIITTQCSLVLRFVIEHTMRLTMNHYV
jgi:hypothetical protein